MPNLNPSLLDKKIANDPNYENLTTQQKLDYHNNYYLAYPSNDEERKEEADMIFRMKEMRRLFPNLPFSPNSNDYYILDNVLVENTLAVIYIECNCHCFGRIGTTENEFRKPKKIITIKRKNRYITYRDFYSTMNRYKNWISCDHSFLEQLIIVDNLVIHMGFGS